MSMYFKYKVEIAVCSVSMFVIKPGKHQFFLLGTWDIKEIS